MSPRPQREVLPAPERHWYGWQALSIDGGVAALGLSGLALAMGEHTEARENATTALLLVGAVAYGAGGPAFHLIHERPWPALGSLGLRAALPVVGGALGLGATTCPPPGGEYGNCGEAGLIIGAGLGVVLAMALDDGLLAWERPKADASPHASLSIAPLFSSDGRRELRVVGTF